ncbi:MAG: YitT family protein [Clostridiales bacterium]|nr:YitT family protein [Clostridiales bacterium]
MKKFYTTEVWNGFLIMAGLLLCTCAYCMFLVPCEVAAGGFTGIGQLLAHITDGRISVGIVPIILNIPLFGFSIKMLGWRMGIKSVIAMMLLSVLIDWAPLPAVTDDMLLASVFGGVLGGIGFGLILRGGATTGGSDMLGKLLHKKMSFISVGMFVCIVDALVILASAFVFETSNALYALISVVIMNYLLDLTLEGPDSARAYFIISEKSDAIAQIILREMERGVTGLSGRGMYSGTERNVLLCVVNRMESIRLRQIVMSVDEKAFVIATNVHEALGEGFKQY